MPVEEMIVLASSLKMKGRCLAGLSTRDGSWIRPVSDWEHGELYPSEINVDGREPRPLDVVRFASVEAAAEPAQPENVLIAEKAWKLVRQIAPADAYAELAAALVPGPDLFDNPLAYVAEEVADAGIEASLALVEPDEGVSFEVHASSYNGQLRARAIFALSSQDYDLPVTETRLKEALIQAGEGAHDPADLGFPAADRTLLSVSLGQPLNGRNWKLVVGRIPAA